MPQAEPLLSPPGPGRPASQAGERVAQGWWARPWVVAAVLVGLTAVAYSPVRRFGFVSFDDPSTVYEEPHVRAGLTAASWRWAWTSFDDGPWWPLSRVSYLWDAWAFGLDPRAMHVENVALHAAAGVLLYLWLAEATGAAARAAVVASLFVVHPVHVESVAWITERRDVLSGSLLMGAAWAYVRHARTGGRAAYAAAVGLYAASLLAKATGMTAPALLLLLDVWPLRRAGRVGWRRLLWEKVPFVALAVPVAVLALHGQRANGSAASLAAAPVAARVANALVTTVLYAAKTAVPTGLSPMYLPPRGGWSPGQVVAAAAVLSVAGGVAYWYRRRWPYVAVGLAWFVVALSPTSGLAQSGRHAMADRYSYLPSIGLLTATVWGVADGLLAVLPRPAVARRTAAALAAVAVAALTVACRAQVGYWRDGRTLFAHALAVSGDNWVALYMMGGAAVADHDYRAAAVWFGRALDANPDAADASDDLGNCVYRVDPAAAIPFYRAAIRTAPDDARAYANLANALLATGQTADAVRASQRSLLLDPTSEYNRRLLDRALRRQGAASARHDR